jgi:hypothetical protein
MFSDLLTRDNNQFSRVTIHLPVPIHNGAIAINCTDEPDATTLAYVAASIADSTRRAYRCDLEHFTAWGGVIPASDVQVASYLAAHAETLAVATLTRRLVSISLAHRAKGHTSPTASELVRATMRGIRRTHGVAQAQATPLLRDDLFQVLDHMGDRLKDLRDRALLLVGFAGGFRCSEVVGLDHGDLQVVRQGMIIHVRRSKTDQDGAGRKIGIPSGAPATVQSEPLMPGKRPPRSMRGQFFGPWTGTTRSPSAACLGMPCRPSSGNGSTPPGSTPPDIPATACVRVLQPARRKLGSHRGRSDRKRVTPAMPCWPDMSATARCLSATQQGRFSRPLRPLNTMIAVKARQPAFKSRIQSISPP